MSNKIAEKISIATSIINDQATKEDKLGFAPYIDALASFIVHHDTKPPLTVSIEGDWGAGKTSFILQLKETLKDMKKITFSFNALIHDKEDALCAAFAEEFIQEIPKQIWKIVRYNIFYILRHLFLASYKDMKINLSHENRKEFSGAFKTRLTSFRLLKRKNLSFIEAWKSFFCEYFKNTLKLLQILKETFFLFPPPRIKLLIKRIKWSYLFFSLLKAVLWGAFTSLIVWVLYSYTDVLTWFMKAEKINDNMIYESGGFLIFIYILYKIYNFIHDSKDVVSKLVDLKKVTASPDYQGQKSFISVFHDDFKKIIESYTGKKPVYVFIDDIDRCSVLSVDNIMKMLNLMITNNLPLIFVIGMDRKKVAAAIAESHKAILKYLLPANIEFSEKQSLGFDPLDGLGFGYEYIEKFFQVSFTVPKPTTSVLEDFLSSI